MPAGLNNIVGLKPSLGLVSNAGLVPACRTLDCISVFALTTDDAWTTLEVISGPDAADPYSRNRPVGDMSGFPTGARIGVPLKGQRILFGDRASEAAYDAAIEKFAALAQNFRGRYRGALRNRPACSTMALGWRSAISCLKSVLTSSPDSIHPVTKEIIVVPGARPAPSTLSRRSISSRNAPHPR